MLSKNQIKKLRSLQRKKERLNTGLYTVEGKKIVEEVINTSSIWLALYATSTWFQSHPEYRSQENCFELSEKDLEQISTLKTPNEVLLVLKQNEKASFSEVKSEALLLALDSVKDPGNLGTIIRLADWFGVKHILCSSDCVEQYNPKTVQSAMGSIDRVQLHYGNLPMMLTELKTHQIYACDLDGESLYTTGISNKSVLVMGSESHGISDEILQKVNQKVTIPNFSSSSIDSLNVATATAIFLSEFRSK